MTTDNNKNSQRNKRCTVSFTEEEHKTIFDAAIVKNYSNKAIARFIREELLLSISSAEKPPTVFVPKINEAVQKDLHGAVTNLNQSVKKLNQIAQTSTYGEQLTFAKKMMRDALAVNNHCKALHDFSIGKNDNKALIRAILLKTFTSEELKLFAAQKLKIEEAN